MAAVWPASLPQSPLLEGYDETLLQDPVLRTDLPAGRPKTRLLFNFVPFEVQMQMIFDETQMETFRVFFEDTVNYGSTSFEWKLPRDSSNGRLFKFIGRYQKQALACGVYRVSFTVEAYPIVP